MTDVKVIANSYPNKIHCECSILKIQGIQIHATPINRDTDVCPNSAYLKFEIGGEAEWLCAECLKHHMPNFKNHLIKNIFSKAVI